ncbi:MAG: hypothetical protein IT380_20515 [Myxococcales bacterium]|nr:hypothetical protein [Myxococcales bacterium]
MILLSVVLAAAPMNTSAIKAELVKKHGDAHQARIERGVDQVAALWKKEDGELSAFARENFLVEPKDLDATFARFEAHFEQLDGHLLEIGRELRKPTDLDVGPLLKVDPLFAAYDPSAHVTEDLFASKLAFVALLNFPLTTLDQRMKDGPSWSRAQWAQARLTGRFARRVPAAVQQEITAQQAAADLYIAEYNLWMHHVLSEKGERLFPSGKRLISHWNLRDELKANYADKAGLDKQRTIIKVMERIVTQTIPQAVIDNPRVDWNPFTNTLVATPAAELEAAAPNKPASTDPKSEPYTRYARLWANYAAQKKADPFSPTAPTAIDRAFSLGAEMPEARVKGLLEEVLKSPLVPKVAAELEARLGRKLEPLDLWYNGFLPRGAIPEAQLDAKTRAKYPTADAFAKDIPRILQGLGFSADRARYLAERIKVDPSRGAGHAMQSARRGDFPRLRTRVEKDGMNYKGYNIAVHELGHNVEQVFSLYDVDHTLLAGVPNTAFTEAIAFVFQAKDLELLGLGKPDAEQERLRVLNDFWMTWEIAGVALVDIEVWHWMYAHPKATPQQLRDATVEIAKRIWNQYYAPVLGGKDTPLLGIYSHMISYPMYLFNYPLGHLIAFQIEEQVKKTGKIGPEIERMATVGAVSPDLWMTKASGEGVSAGPLLRATEAALKK